MLLAGTPAALSDEPPGRDVVARLLDADGKPCPGIAVGLLGIYTEVNEDWPAERAHETAPPGWRFVTDKDGYFTVHLGAFLSYEHEQSHHVLLPGWGSFYLVARKKGMAGAVSPRIDNFPEKDIEGLRPPDLSPADEKINDKIIRLSQPRTEIQMQFVRGIYLKGQMLRDDGKPDVDRVVEIEVPTSGLLSRVFSEINRVGPRGEFQFYHVYPAPFQVNISSRERDWFWKRTLLRGQQFEAPASHIIPQAGEREIDMLIETSRTPYRYFGKVSDERGNAIHGAEVSITVSPVRNDLIRKEKATSDAEGNWELLTGVSFAYEITIRAAGFHSWTMIFQPTTMPKERKYDCTLTASQP